MGSKSRSSTASTNITKDTTINNVDNRVAEGDASIGGNINVNFSDLKTGNGASVGNGGDIVANISTSDFGALDAASDIADDAFEFSNQTLSQAGSTVSGAVSALRQTARDAVDVAESAARDESARTMQFVVLGVIVVGVAFALRKTIQRAF